MENKNSKEELIKELQALLENEDAHDAYVKAKILSKRWKRVREEEESFYERELLDKYNTVMDELAKRAGDIAINVEDKKKAIIARAKEILESKSYRKGNDQMAQLLEDWKQSGRLNREKDDELWNEFKTIRNEFFEKKNEYFANLKENYANNKQLKEELIEKAKGVLELESIKEGIKQTASLMDEWKKIGSAGHKEDEKLWNAFLTERKAFYDKRDAFYDDMKETYAKRVADKKDLISQAKLFLARSEFNEEEINSVKELRSKWKEVGHAGKDNEDGLWEEFNSVVNKYYENMKYYKE